MRNDILKSRIHEFNQSITLDKNIMPPMIILVFWKKGYNNGLKVSGIFLFSVVMEEVEKHSQPRSLHNIC